jgi:hypothetical protein
MFGRVSDFGYSSTPPCALRGRGVRDLRVAVLHGSLILMLHSITFAGAGCDSARHTKIFCTSIFARVNDFVRSSTP